LQGQFVDVALPLAAALGHTIALEKRQFLKRSELTLNGIDRLLVAPTSLVMASRFHSHPRNLQASAEGACALLCRWFAL
jgi:hypothetical protein